MRRSWGKSCPSFFHNFFQKKTPKLFQAFSQKQKNCNISWSRTPPSNSGFMLCIFCCILYHQAFSKKQNCDTSWSRTLASAPARSNSRTMSWLSKHTAIMSADHPRLCIRNSRSAPFWISRCATSLDPAQHAFIRGVQPAPCLCMHVLHYYCYHHHHHLIYVYITYFCKVSWEGPSRRPALHIYISFIVIIYFKYIHILYCHHFFLFHERGPADALPELLKTKKKLKTQRPILLTTQSRY